ncbi:MAG: pentapeptide repeat-containing protein [Haliscomenobacteraceae bacterium CHB4]|nr:hypothetical protein [Saprospiraceae bacterium]MCE7922068.1 pentapeptide repeat-containing protein [Haliscomenobacteraceae bacterium CHB4]
MANAEHLAILKQGVEVWNKWREENKDIRPDLSNSNLSGARLSGIYLSGADLSGSHFSDADLSKAYLSDADLSGALLRNAYLVRAHLPGANLSGADMHNINLSWSNISYSSLAYANLSSASLFRTDLTGANLTGANLTGANLTSASLLETNLTNANIQGANIYGISVWDIKKDRIIQKDLVVTKPNEPTITVDDLEIAQFIYLLLNNQKFRDVIETVTSKAVLILGRFTDERKKVLDAIREELRNRNFLPILFDFEKPATRDLTETISILAKLSRFVIADLTDAKSIPQELSHIIPFMPNLPVIPIILQGQRKYAMFEHWRPYPWVLPIYEYENEGHLISTLSAEVIEPAERKVQEIRGIK